jgi:hypothetical protein
MRDGLETTRGRIPQIWTFVNGKRPSAILGRGYRGGLVYGEGRSGARGLDLQSKWMSRILNACLES